jgi:TonB family protein
MEQPFHSQRAVQQSRFTPAKIAGLAASIALQAGFVFAIISGLAGTLISKLPQELKVAVEQEKITPKPPPPVVHQSVTTPVSIGRAHTCTNMPYPAVAQRLGQEGTTTLAFKIGTDGSVSSPSVSKSSGFDSLDSAALSCVGHWRYTPQKVDGNPVEATWTANVVWKIPR